ncbi:hypothetical protein K3495_g13079 [Podosphaera aphanis]|nr:hypothetical protein K3495_g13079 [Podosphaera aphanis]
MTPNRKEFAISNLVENIPKYGIPTDTSLSTTALPPLNSTTALPPLNSTTALPPLNSTTALPPLNSTTALPRTPFTGLESFALPPPLNSTTALPPSPTALRSFALSPPLNSTTALPPSPTALRSFALSPPLNSTTALPRTSITGWRSSALSAPLNSTTALPPSPTGLRSSPRKRNYASWTNQESAFLVYLLEEAKIQGELWNDSSFKSSTFDNIAERFHDPLKTGGTDGTCRSKWIRLKKDYQQVNFLVDKCGFEWDDEQKLPTAEDAIWQTLTHGHSEKMKWRTEPFPLYKKIKNILEGPSSMGNKNSISNNNESKDKSDPKDKAPMQVEDEEDQDDGYNDIYGRGLHPSQKYSVSQPKPSPTYINIESQAGSNKRDSSDPRTPTQGPRKRPKTSGATPLDSMAYNIKPIFNILTSESKLHKENVESSLSGQAMILIQKEACLTHEGQLALMDCLNVDQRVIKYMAMEKNDELREKWIRRELRRYVSRDGGKTFEELYIDWR